MAFENGFTGDGFTEQPEEERAEQEACDRAAEGLNESPDIDAETAQIESIKHELVSITINLTVSQAASALMALEVATEDAGACGEQVAFDCAVVSELIRAALGKVA